MTMPNPDAGLGLWRNIVRGLDEELLGAPESDGSDSHALTVRDWPLLRSLGKARTRGAARAFCFGIGCDALTLAATFPTVLVLDADVFDHLFGEAVDVNDEGNVVAHWPPGADSAPGIAFTEENVRRLLDHEPMAPPGAACLALSWRHRDLLLGG
ncbi:hypothetical protein [Embleya sp. NPDC059259]|uniref:hypothetical protein n=1 Tax=unclassified Embleya TaxID=2699296 RepID=UPI0036ABCDFC